MVFYGRWAVRETQRLSKSTFIPLGSPPPFPTWILNMIGVSKENSILKPHLLVILPISPRTSSLWTLNLLWKRPAVLFHDSSHIKHTKPYPYCRSKFPQYFLMYHMVKVNCYACNQHSGVYLCFMKYQSCKLMTNLAHGRYCWATLVYDTSLSNTSWDPDRSGVGVCFYPIIKALLLYQTIGDYLYRP